MCHSRTSDTAQAGFTLAGLIVILTVISIFVAYTVPRQWSIVMARERDRQAIFAMRQYARAIRAFQQKNGAAPVSLEQLKAARAPRLLRGKSGYIDPLTGKFDWVPIPMTALTAQQMQQVNQGTLPPGVVQGAGPDQSFPAVGFPGRPAQPPTAPPQQVQPTPESGPGGYSGPIVGVRPNKSGPSYVSLNGADSYEQWSYTTVDLEREIVATQQSVLSK